MNVAIWRIKLRMYIDTKAVDLEYGSSYESTPFVRVDSIRGQRRSQRQDPKHILATG